jgi:hypothetical protein
MGAPPRLPNYGYPTATDFIPDAMLLLIKAAINLSWRCDQKLLPACEGEGEESVAPDAPIPTVIKCRHVPVTSDSGDDLVMFGSARRRH